MTKLAWVGAGALVAVAWCWSAEAQQPLSDQAPAGYPGNGVITHFQDQSGGPTVLTIVDPQKRVLAVYAIDRSTGSIKLKSVRNYEWDLRLINYNSDNPTPEDIRRGFDRQQ